MIDKRHIEQVLKLNGLNPSSPDDQIKSLLISARWHEDDVETALVVLREDPKKQTQHIDTVHKVFRSDQRLSPDTLNSLLGIDIEIDSIVSSHAKTLERAYRVQIYSMLVVSVVIATLFLVSIMWFLKIGIFATYV